MVYGPLLDDLVEVESQAREAWEKKTLAGLAGLDRYLESLLRRKMQSAAQTGNRDYWLREEELPAVRTQMLQRITYPSTRNCTACLAQETQITY
jgi:hypothetical protein